MAKSNEQSADSENASTKKPSVMGWFRQTYRSNPKLLRMRSNGEITRLWLDDHPGETEMPPSVRNIMANVKSLLNRKRKQAKASRAAGETEVKATQNRHASSALATLEDQIDEALTLARGLDRVRLEHVIKLLRKARNTVVLLGP